MKNNINTSLTTLFLAFLVLFSSCESFIGDDIENPEVNYFIDSVNLTGLKELNYVNDTLWFDYTLPESLIDYYSYNTILLENATGFLKGTVNMLLTFNDSTDFSSTNFEILVDTGELNLVQVVNSTYLTYYFDVKFGKPSANSKVKIGLVGHFPAVYAMELKSVIYYGPNRTDYDDFSVSNNKSEISHVFNIPNVNEQLFYALPISIQQYYSSYYTDYAIANKWFCFVEFSNR